MTQTFEPLAVYPDDPSSAEGARHPFTAFNQGHEAARMSIKKNRNPYQKGSRERKWWNDGYVHFWKYDFRFGR